MINQESFAIDRAFDPPNQRGFYGAVIERLVEPVDLDSVSTLVDLGCGSGIVTTFILNRIDQSVEKTIYALDPSEAELNIAKKRISDPRVKFLCASALELTDYVRNVDAVVLANVIHLFPMTERQEVIRGVAKALRPAGVFTFSTPFFEGAVVPETNYFYIQWLQSAVAYLKRRGIEPDFSQGKCPALQFFHPSQYEEILQQTGFKNIVSETPVFDWTFADWLSVSQYEMFVRGALPGVDYQVGFDALREGLRVAYDNQRLDTVPRRWLQIKAVKE